MRECVGAWVRGRVVRESVNLGWLVYGSASWRITTHASESVTQSSTVCVNLKGRHRRTSQSFTPFMISCSRANAARSRWYASLSPSANSSGTRCMRDQIFSHCSSLGNCTTSISRPGSPKRKVDTARQVWAPMYHLTRFPSLQTEKVRPCAPPFVSTHLFSMFPFPTR